MRTRLLLGNAALCHLAADIRMAEWGQITRIAPMCPTPSLAARGCEQRALSRRTEMRQEKTGRRVSPLNELCRSADKVLCG